MGSGGEFDVIDVFIDLWLSGACKKEGNACVVQSLFCLPKKIVNDMLCSDTSFRCGRWCLFCLICNQKGKIQNSYI